MVSPVKQIWKDFSSGKGGNSVTFLMEHEHFTYPEAIKYLANKYGIEVEETIVSNEDLEQANEKESMYLVSEFARDYFHKTMLNTDEGQAIGLSYFKERGFTKDTIEKFQLGYSPDIWDAFTKAEFLDQWTAPKPFTAKTKCMNFAFSNSFADMQGNLYIYKIVGA